VETVARPHHHPDKQVSFLWTPGSELAELLYTPGNGLIFALKDSNGISYAETIRDFHPPEWIRAYAEAGALRLPSQLEQYGSIDHLANSCLDFIHRYFDCDPAFERVAVLYALHTWFYEKFHAVPYLRFLGISGSGKTRGTETIGAICYRPLVIAGSATPAPMYRLIEAVGGTMLLDEADFQDSQIGADIAKVLNCGYQKGLPVSRMEKTPDGYVPRLYEVFGPKIINGRRAFKDDATESRCLGYTTALTERHDIPPQLPPEFRQEADHILNRALTWRMVNLDSFKPQAILIPEIRRRTNQILMPLFSIANLMEPSEGDKYRKALLSYALAMETEALEGRKETVEGRLLQAYIDLSGSSALTCKDIAARAVENAGDDDPKLKDWLSPKKASGILRNMGFTTKHSKRGAVAQIDPNRLAALSKRYGTVTEPSPLPSPPGDDGDDRVIVHPEIVTPCNLYTLNTLYR
jgi:hypothetical protein